MSGTDHWMRFHVGDYLADTMHLSAIQHGIYILLIMHYFKRGALPEDRSALARVAKVAPQVWHFHAAPVMQLFQRVGGRWRHKRIDAERAMAAVYYDNEAPTTAPRLGQNGLPKKRIRFGPNESSNDGGKPPFSDRLARAAARARPEPQLKLVKGGRSSRPPARGGFAHNIAARQAQAGDD